MAYSSAMEGKRSVAEQGKRLVPVILVLVNFSRVLVAIKAQQIMRPGKREALQAKLELNSVRKCVFKRRSADLELVCANFENL